MTGKKGKGQIHAIVPDAVSANVRNFAGTCQERTKAGMERSAMTEKAAPIGARYFSPGQAVLRAALGSGTIITTAALQGQEKCLTANHV
jgi:hypothetical protein